MKVWDDAVAGLVTGPSYLEEDTFTVRPPAQPVVPEVDISEVRRAVDAALLGDDEPEAAAAPARRRAGPQPPQLLSGGSPGLMAPNPRAGWPRTPSVRQLAGLRARREPQLPPPKWLQQRRRSPGGAAGGVIAVLVVIGVLLWIVISIIAGIAGTIADILG